MRGGQEDRNVGQVYLGQDKKYYSDKLIEDKKHPVFDPHNIRIYTCIYKYYTTKQQGCSLYIIYFIFIYVHRTLFLRQNTNNCIYGKHVI